MFVCSTVKVRLAPPTHLGDPPLLGFSIKNRPPPSRCLGGSPFPSREQKKKNIETSTEVQEISTETSTLWTDAGVDPNFQRDSGAIGPCNFKGNFLCTNPLDQGPWCFVFTGNLDGPMALKVRRKSPPRLLSGPTARPPLSRYRV